jgi:hypothetical protein
LKSKVSPEDARNDYGVVLVRNEFAVDGGLTAQR